MRTLASLIAALTLLAVLPAASTAGTFLISCNTYHAQVDPIVSPGVAPSAHLHELWGATGINAFSDVDSLQNSGSTCDFPRDTAGYWAPAVITQAGGVVQALAGNVYYLNPGGKRHPFAEGLKHVQGNPNNTSTATYAATWGCGVVTNRVTIPTSCAPGQGIRMSMYWPDCWNGRELDNATHKTLAACGTAGYKIKVPQLQYFVDYPPAAVGGHLSSDQPGAPPGTSTHADFFNGWDPFDLATIVAKCVNVTDAQCRVDLERQAIVDTNATGRPVILQF